jgi:hypothetical protein
MTPGDEQEDPASQRGPDRFEAFLRAGPAEALSSPAAQDKGKGGELNLAKWGRFLTGDDSLGDLDSESLLHLFLPVAQLRSVFAARHKFLRVVAAVLSPHILGRP